MRARAALVLAGIAGLPGCSLVGLGGLSGGSSEDASVEGAADAATPRDGSGSGDAAREVATDARPPADATEEPEAASDPGILCHPARCDPTSEYCCYRYVSGTGFVYTCTADDGGTCLQSLKVRCTSSRDCVVQGAGGQVCCAVYDDAGNARTVDCEDPAACSAYPVHAIFCDPSAPECTTGQTCRPDPDTQGFFTCQ